MAINQDLIKSIMSRRQGDEAFRTPGIFGEMDQSASAPRGGIFSRLKQEQASEPSSPSAPTTPRDTFEGLPEGVTPQELEAAREAARSRSSDIGERIGRFIVSLGAKEDSREIFDKRDKRFMEEEMSPLEDRAAQRAQLMEEQLVASQEGRARAGETRAQQEASRTQSKFEREQSRLEQYDDPNSQLSTAAREIISLTVPEDVQQQVADAVGASSWDDVTFTEISELGFVPADVLNQVQERTFEAQEAALEAAREAAEPSEAAKVTERETSKDFQAFRDAGGIQAQREAISELRAQIPQLRESDNISGFLLGKIPRTFRPDISREVQSNIEKHVNTLLRQTLGAQFTEKEGERILAQTFDPNASEEVNIRNLQELVTSLENNLESKMQAYSSLPDDVAGIQDFKQNYEGVSGGRTRNGTPKPSSSGTKTPTDMSDDELSRGLGL